MKLPKVGDRVNIGNNSERFVVVAVDELTESISLLPESEVETVPLDHIRPISDASDHSQIH